MPLSPLDVSRHEFSKVMRGYDPAEVHAFLERLADELFQLQSQNLKLAEDVKNCDSKLDAYRALEQSLRDSLVASQEGQRSLREQMETEREQILREARLTGDEIRLEAERDVLRTRQELRELVLHKEAYIKRLRFLLRNHAELLDLLEEANPELEQNADHPTAH